MRYISQVFFIIFFLAFPLANSTQAACPTSGLKKVAVAGAVAMNGTCTIAADTERLYDYTTTQNSINTAVVTITAAITMNSGVSATTRLGGGSFVLGTNGSISIDSTDAEIKPNYPVWVVDDDVDGYWASNTAYTATNSGATKRQRLGLMKDDANADCDDTTYNATNTCYAAFYPAFYPAFSPYGTFNPYGTFYPHFSP